MAVLTTLAQLEAVQSAITDILSNGQAYALGTRSSERARLKDLRDMERELLNRYQTEQHGRMTNYGRFDSPD